MSFTGSTRIGRGLYGRCAVTMKRLALELGGSAPFVVLDGADLEHALEHALVAKFRNCGQYCVAANCFYVHDHPYDRFVSGLAQSVGAMRLGDPLDPETDLGPVINAGRRSALEGVVGKLADAGFETVAQASPPAGEARAQDCFLPPVVLGLPRFDAVEPGLLYEELFGPVVMVVGFSDAAELLSHLKQNPLGLAAYVFSRDVAKAVGFALGLDVGITGINEGVPSAVNAPMGGVKDSGIGREGGRMGLELSLIHI